MYDADVLIAGGGPAGLAASLYAARAGLSAIVCEPRPAPIDKACGEGIMPGGLSLLRELGADPSGVPFRGIAYLDGQRRVEAVFRDGPGLGVRRTVLHQSLVDCGVPLVSRRITTVDQDAFGVTAGGLRARWLIAADGLHSPVRRSLGVTVRPGSPRRFGVRWHFRTPRWSDFVEVWWSRWGEAYVTPVSSSEVGVAILSASKPDLAWFPGLVALLGDASRGRVRGAGPLRQVVSQRVAGRVLLVGDAAGYEDALTGEGISLALKQARAAVGALAAGQPDRYSADWRRITRSYRLLTRGLVVSTQPAFARRTIVPLASALPAVFAGVVNTLAR